MHIPVHCGLVMTKHFSEIGLSRRIKASQLVIFDRVVETGSILRAANELQMTQPSVTKVVQELESSM